MDTPTITTDRLLLNRLGQADAPALFAYRSLPDVARFQSFEPNSMEDAEAFIRSCAGVEFGAAESWAQLAVRSKETDELLGDVGIHFLEEGTQQVEIGFTIAPKFQGRGLGSEAVCGLIDCLFGILTKHRVTASVDPRNAASMALLKSVGLRQEAHFHESLCFKGEWVDDVVWAMLRKEWLGLERRDT
ncbi:MAG: GNAT family protein [Planctomycetota bacterium]|nr:GNAT family protein [Planctomycetota bacterium]